MNVDTSSVEPLAPVDTRDRIALVRELERLREERDLYLALASIGGESEVEPFLARALELLVETSRASHGYIELREERVGGGRGARPDARTWSLARGCTDGQIADIRKEISRSIISDSISSGRTVETTSARSDARFSSRASIQMRKIDAVLCAPLGVDSVIGAIYLQSHVPFHAVDRSRVALIAGLLSPIGQRLIERRRLARKQDEMSTLRSQYDLDGLIGDSPALAVAVRHAMQVAGLDITVLLTGASGTGKSQLARLIHRNSARASGPMVELNCAAIPETLLESELFGARAGSHSEARRDVVGKVAAAEGGTLFLDEIGELPVTAQAKLLQLLQSRTYYPLGATEPRRADIRVIAATNIDLGRAVAERRFRQDLLFRLEVMPIRLPSLAERPEDLVELAREIALRTAKRHSLPACDIGPAATRAIGTAERPGNVRQLSNMLEAAVVRAAVEGSTVIQPQHLFTERPFDADEDDPSPSFQDATRAFQKRLLEKTLAAVDWNVSEAARRLDIARSHAYNLIHTYGLERDGAEEPPQRCGG
jgi:Nif-specific regulatory protein